MGLELDARLAHLVRRFRHRVALPLRDQDTECWPALLQLESKSQAGDATAKDRHIVAITKVVILVDLAFPNRPTPNPTLVSFSFIATEKSSQEAHAYRGLDANWRLA